MIRIIAIVLFAGLLSFTRGQEVLSFNLDKAIEVALAGNHSLKQVRLDKLKAEEQVREAYGTSLFPNISGSANYTRAVEKASVIFEMQGQTQEFFMTQDNTVTAGINAEQPLFTGAMFLAVKIARTYADISKYNEKFNEVDLVSKVKSSYYTYLLADEYVKLAELQLKRAEENLKNTTSRFDAGLVSEYDKIQAGVQKSNSVPAVINANQQKKLAENNLKMIMGLELDTKIEINDSLSLQLATLPDFMDGMKMVYQNSPLLKQSELSENLQELNASYQATKHFPELNAFANYQVQAMENDPRSFSDFRFKTSVNVGLSLSVPIFDGLARFSRVEQAELDHKIAKEALKETQKLLRTQYENIYTEIQKNEKQIFAYQEAVVQAEKGYSLITKRYNAGLASQIEVTTAMVDVTSARLNYLNSLSNYYINQAELNKLFGKKAN